MKILSRVQRAFTKGDGDDAPCLFSNLIQSSFNKYSLKVGIFSFVIIIKWLHFIKGKKCTTKNKVILAFHIGRRSFCSKYRHRPKTSRSNTSWEYQQNKKKLFLFSNFALRLVFHSRFPTQTSSAKRRSAPTTTSNEKVSTLFYKAATCFQDDLLFVKPQNLTLMLFPFVSCLHRRKTHAEEPS